jgi:rare lipoprotein A
MRSARECAGALAAAALMVLLAGCGSVPPQPELQDDYAHATQKAVPVTPSRGGGYYKNDGPGDNPPDIDRIEDAEPRGDPLHRFANNPYTVFGRSYTPLRSVAPFKQRGLASWYGRMFHGKKTSSGEVYDMYAMTAAHPTLPIPSYAKVTNLRNNRSVVVRVNDRGPFHVGRVIDLSFTAAAKLGYIDSGSVQVEVELIQPADFPRYARRAPGPVVVAAPAPTSAPAQLAVISQAQAAESAAEAISVYVQIGTFAAQQNAESLRLRVSKEMDWLKDFVEVLQREGAFRVQVGPYRSRADAALAAQRIREKLQITPVLVSR